MPRTKKQQVDEAAEDEDAVEDGEQLQLLDVEHPQSKPIRRVAGQYKKVVGERVALTQKEVELKDKLKTLVRETNMKPDADGVIKFKTGQTVVTITPRDELVRVKQESEDTEE